MASGQGRRAEEAGDIQERRRLNVPHLPVYGELRPTNAARANCMLADAAYGGQVHIAQWALVEGATLLDWPFATACAEGHLPLAAWLLLRQPTMCLDRALLMANAPIYDWLSAQVQANAQASAAP